MIRPIRVILGTALALALAPATVLAGGGWIDAQAGGWNQPEGGIPFAPGSDPGDIGRCSDQVRPAQTPEEFAVDGSGWWIFGSMGSDFGVTVISGLTGFDGMCRPMAFQNFVFVDGWFAGTLSPELMDSRSDGVLSSFGINSPDEIVAQYSRYTPADPLCCPSRTSTVVYYVDRAGAPYVVAGMIDPGTPAVAAPSQQPSNGQTTTPSTTAPSITAPAVAAGPPKVSLDNSDDRVEPNSRFKIELNATSAAGVDKVRWWITGTDDDELKANHERPCDGEVECKETWRLRTFDSGLWQIHAKAIDKLGVESAEVVKDLRVRTSASKPTVIVRLSDDEVESGARANVELIGKDEDGLDKMWWFATGTTDADLLAMHEELCDGDTRCSRSWRTRPGATGEIQIHAKAKDKGGRESDEVIEALTVRGKNVKPTLEMLLPAEEFASGDTVRIELVGKDDEGIAKMWWWVTDTNDVALQADHEEICDGDKECRRTWRVVPKDTGKIRIHARAVDGRDAESEEIVKLIRIKS